MKEYYLIKKINKTISAKNNAEIVTRIREIEWKNKSDNNDYMYVYAFWKNQNSDLEIRYENEQDFIEDLFRMNEIKKISFIDFLSMKFFGKI